MPSTVYVLAFHLWQLVFDQMNNQDQRVFIQINLIIQTNEWIECWLEDERRERWRISEYESLQLSKSTTNDFLFGDWYRQHKDLFGWLRRMEEGEEKREKYLHNKSTELSSIWHWMIRKKEREKKRFHCWRNRSRVRLIRERQRWSTRRIQRVILTTCSHRKGVQPYVDNRSRRKIS